MKAPVIPNLNKENFWNEVFTNAPKAVQHFCDWIDVYKRKVNWNALFGERVKFHDIPYEMQVGILQAYLLEYIGEQINHNDENDKAELAQWFLEREAELNAKQSEE